MKGKKHSEIQNNGRKGTKTDKLHAITPGSGIGTQAAMPMVPDVHSSITAWASLNKASQADRLISSTEKSRFAILIGDDVPQELLENVLNHCWNHDIQAILFSERAGRVLGSQGMVYTVLGCPPAAEVLSYAAIVFLHSATPMQHSKEIHKTLAFLRAAVQSGMMLYHHQAGGAWLQEILAEVSGNTGIENMHSMEGTFFNTANISLLELLHPIHRQ